MKRSKLLIPAIVIALLMSIGLITIFASPIILVTPISGTVSEADLNQIATFDLTLEDSPSSDVTIRHDYQ
jgi:outer membrane murein-binding lipoprotein Lpp